MAVVRKKECLVSHLARKSPSIPSSPAYLWKLGVWVAVVDRFPVPLQIVLGMGLVVRLEARLIAPRMPYDGRVSLEARPLRGYVQRTCGDTW